MAQPDPRDDLDPLADEVQSAVLADEEGESYVVDQQNQNEEVARGSGEWPSPEAPPEPPAPGSADD
jgi:hypothetical protein